MSDAREGLIWDAVAGRLDPPPAVVLLGSKFVDVEPGRAKMEFEAKEDFYNPAGVVHGGFLAAMLDDTMGPAAASTVGPDEFVTTVEMKVNFMRPARAGKIIGQGQVVHRGRSLIFVEATLCAEDESLIATGTGTWRVIPAPKEGDTS